MSLLDNFNSSGFGGSLTNGLASGSGKKKRRPQTMADWQSFVDGLSRPERDQLYPGMHKDLIPAYEMITAGDQNYGAEGGVGMSKTFGNAEQAHISQDAGQYLSPFGTGEEENGEDGPTPGRFQRQTGADGMDGATVPVGVTHPSYGLIIKFKPSRWLDRNKEYSSRLYLDGVEMGAPSSHEGADSYIVDPGDFQQVELSFSSPGDFFEISGSWTYE